MRMYQRWIERSGFESQIVDVQVGEEVGIKSATLLVSGECAYGHLQTERGVHRLVRISHSTRTKRRHTSFASVDVVPEIAIPRLSKSIRPSGRSTHSVAAKRRAKRQKVETPCASCTNQPASWLLSGRAQPGAQRELALKMLKANFTISSRTKARRDRRRYGEKGEIAWGNQIRSYVFQPIKWSKTIAPARDQQRASRHEREIDPFTRRNCADKTPRKARRTERRSKRLLRDGAIRDSPTWLLLGVRRGRSGQPGTTLVRFVRRLLVGRRTQVVTSTSAIRLRCFTPERSPCNCPEEALPGALIPSVKMAPTLHSESSWRWALTPIIVGCHQVSLASCSSSIGSASAPVTPWLVKDDRARV